MQQRSWHRWRRRLPLYLLLVGLGVLVVQYLKRQPVEVRVSYQFGALREGLDAASMRYHDAARVVAHVRFSYRARQAPGTEQHVVRLAPGDYSVMVELGYREATQAASAAKRLKHVVSTAGSSLTLRRPLIVRSAGAVTVFLDDV